MKYLKFLIILIFPIINIGCEGDAEISPKDYPIVLTSVPFVDNTGVVFSADIKDWGTKKILKYGFVWSKNENPTLEDNHILINGAPSEKSFTQDINTGLASGVPYNVRAYVLTEGFEVYGNEIMFKSKGSLAPSISSISPLFGPIGTKVTIEGENFSEFPNENKVTIGSTEVIVESEAKNKIIITIPPITMSEKAPIRVETAGMTAISKDAFDMWFPWKRVSDFEKGWPYSNFPVSFALNGKGYFGLGSGETEFWEYDPEKDIYTQKKDFPKLFNFEFLSFTANNRGYVLLIHNEPNREKKINELWEYDPANDLWTRKADFPGTSRGGGKGFSINNKGYIVAGYNYETGSYSNDFWEYYPIENIWNRKANFPGAAEFPLAFSIGSDGFVGFGHEHKGIYKYDQISDEWSYYGQGPEANNLHHGKSSIINNKCYALFGEYYADRAGIWEFDIDKNSWKRMRDCPVQTLLPLINFSIDDKMYVGFGNQIYFDYNYRIFWEFEPLKN